MLISDIHPEYFPKTNQSFIIPHRENDIVHYIRKKPTKKQKRVKRFLDKSDLRDDLGKKDLERELSVLFEKYDHQRRARYSVFLLS